MYAVTTGFLSEPYLSKPKFFRQRALPPYNQMIGIRSNFHWHSVYFTDNNTSSAYRGPCNRMLFSSRPSHCNFAEFCGYFPPGAYLQMCKFFSLAIFIASRISNHFLSSLLFQIMQRLIYARNKLSSFSDSAPDEFLLALHL